MALKVVWSERALDELDEIIDYFERHWTEREIRSFFSKLESAIVAISKNPELNKISTRLPDSREYQVASQTTLFYRHDESTVTILLIWPNRKNPEKL